MILTRCHRSKNGWFLIARYFGFLWSWTVAAHQIDAKLTQISWQTMDSFQGRTKVLITVMLNLNVCKNSESFNHNYAARTTWNSRRPTFIFRYYTNSLVIWKLAKVMTLVSQLTTIKCKETIQSQINCIKLTSTWERKIHINDPSFITDLCHFML